jgi:acyl-CoA thioesterase-1
MIDARKQWAGSRIIVMAMNPMAGMRAVIRPFLERYINAHCEVAEVKGAEFVAHRPAWHALSVPTLSAAIPDGSHPLPKMAAAIIVPKLVAQITDGRCATQIVPPTALTDCAFR